MNKLVKENNNIIEGSEDKKIEAFLDSMIHNNKLSSDDKVLFMVFLSGRQDDIVGGTVLPDSNNASFQSVFVGKYKVEFLGSRIKFSFGKQELYIVNKWIEDMYVNRNGVMGITFNLRLVDENGTGTIVEIY